MDFGSTPNLGVDLLEKNKYEGELTRQQTLFANKFAGDNKILSDDDAHNDPTCDYNAYADGGVSVPNRVARLILLAEAVDGLNDLQKKTYDVAVKYIGDNDRTRSDWAPLRMFLSGEGGTGKSHVIKLLLEYTRLRYGKTYGNYSSAMAFGTSGCSSSNLNGRTWQSAIKQSIYATLSAVIGNNDTALAIGANFKGVKLIIIDEVGCFLPKYRNI